MVKYSEHTSWFYESTKTYQRLFSRLEGNKQKNVAFCSIKNHSNVVSHLSVSSDSNILSMMFGGVLEKESELVFFNMGYYSCRDHYESLVGTMLNYICDNFKNISDFYVIVRGADFLSLLESFGGNIVAANKENESIGNIYLLRFDLIKILSHPLVFTWLRESRKAYQEIKEN